MASTASRIQGVSDQLSALQQQAALLLSAVGNGQIDPEALKAAIQAATQAAIDDILAQLSGLEVADLAARVELQRRLTEIKNSVDPDSKFFFEFFNSLYTVAERVTVTGASTVAGDNSVDVDSTSALVAGREYVIEKSGIVAVVTVSQILSDTRFTATEPVTVTITGGWLKRTSWTFGSLSATATDKQVYYSKVVNLDTVNGDDKALVVRRAESSADPKVYFKSSANPTWQEAIITWKRSYASGAAVGGEAGFVDVAYVLPVSGDFQIKVVASGITTIRHIVGMSPICAYRTDDTVRKPTILSPVNAATNVSQTPTINGNAYYSLYGVEQGGVEVQIGADPLFNVIVYSGNAQGKVTSLAIPAGNLLAAKTYFARMRYANSEGVYSSWSDSVGFSTGASYSFLTPPTITEPAQWASDVSLRPTIRTSAFSVVGVADTHLKTQYQIATDETFTALVYDSGESTDLLAHTVPLASALSKLGTFFVRARHKGSTLGFSGWSEPKNFVTTNGVLAPTITAPVNASTEVTIPVSITTGAFSSADTNDSHSATQWQIATDQAFNNIVYDSGDSAALLATSVSTGLSTLTLYYVRSRHKASVTGYSPWSTPVKFTTIKPVGSQLFATPGTYNFTVPAGVTKIHALAIGGGGGGGGGKGGDGGGAPGTTNGVSGGTSSVNATVFVTAYGGNYGVAANFGGTGGNGGGIAGGLGGAGGKGGNGWDVGEGVAGGGGSSGGWNSAGAAGSTVYGGTSPASTSYGGAGGPGHHAAGPGSPYGGGGGGDVDQDMAGGGGGGGGLCYKNDIAVTPGQVITVVVGVGGPGSYATDYPGMTQNKGGNGCVEIRWGSGNGYPR